jgi:hypothetical protein
MTLRFRSIEIMIQGLKRKDKLDLKSTLVEKPNDSFDLHRLNFIFYPNTNA